MDNTKNTTSSSTNTTTSSNAYSTPITTPSNLNTVDATKLNGNDITTPSVPSPTYGGLSGAMESEVNRLKTERDTSAKAYIKAIKEGGDISSSIDRTEQDKYKNLSDEYASQIEAEDLSSRRAIESLEKYNPEGLGKVGLASKISDIQRESLAKQADLAIIQNSYTRKYDAAASIADRALAAKLEQNRVKLDSLKTFYEINKDNFTKADDRLYSERIKEEERKYKKIEDNETLIKDIKLLAAKNNAPISVISKLSSIDTSKPGAFDEALKSVGNYLGDNQIIKLDNGNTIMVNAQGKQIASFGGAKTEGSSNNYAFTKEMIKNNYNNDLVGAIAGTIRKSGAKQSQSTNDAINVIAGLQTLAQDNPTGEFPGLSPIRLLPGKLKSPEAINNLSNIEAINLKVQQWASGAALTEAQTKQVEKITPRKGDTDKQVKTKTNALANYMLGQISGQLAGQGIGFSIKNADLFTKTPEQELADLAKDPIMKKKIEEASRQFPNYSDEEILQIVNG